jgi:hypothetical protein
MSLFKQLISVSLLTGGLLLIGEAAAQQNPTLADVLKQEGIPTPGISVTHINLRITSYASLNDDHEFVIAYYLDNPKNELRFPLLVTSFDKHSGKWRHAELTGLKVLIFEGTAHEIEDDCLGSVLDISRHGDEYFLNLHFNPSAGCLLILDKDLTVSHTLAGWPVAFFKSGAFAWISDMVHFSDIHAETLFLYDPATGKSQQIYPQKNDPLRDDFSTRLEKAINKTQCAENNWACEPDRFATEIDSVEVNDETNALAFQAAFTTEGFLTREEADSSGQWYDDDYVYFFQIDPLRWREFSIYDLKPKFGTDSLKELLSPEKLKRVFFSPAP